MFIWTTAGNYEIVASENPDLLKIRSTTKESLWTIRNTLALSDHEAGYEYYEGLIQSDGHGYAVEYPKGSVCLWMQFELLNYIDYVRFGAALLEDDQTSSAIAFEKLMMALDS